MKIPALVVLASFPCMLLSQSREAEYTRSDTLAIMAEYSNDSSHIIAGVTPNRKIGAAGLQYEHRFWSTHVAEFHYLAEWRPVFLESDPSARNHIVYTGDHAGEYTTKELVLRCTPSTSTYSSPAGSPNSFQVTSTTTCIRQLTFGQGLEPAGFVWKFLPGYRLQPTASWQGGLLLSAKDIPIANAGSFNFTYEFGAGLEYYVSPRHSLRLDYRIHHYSNKDTADFNPGVDSGFFKLSYAFGR